ncbi:secreted protein [Moniliophthora roreri MCA 2997]|uniref:Secreted protein n=1 Tax=Moniliophthora roreri (strain MCA 2997) TaxID=1381753 RepID=V2X556_MONRO|nr:secreted protein [Moniliophthora roreri MCA 2997]
MKAQRKLLDDEDDEKDVYRTIIYPSMTCSNHANRPATLQMKFFATISLAALVAAVQAQVIINTPTNLVECQPVKITWTGGQAPYSLSYVFVTIVRGDQ